MPWILGAMIFSGIAVVAYIVVISLRDYSK
jgi:hypothetical protein